MDSEQLKNEYERFFYRSAEGQYFMQVINAEIDKLITRAERSPESARDSIQEEKGYKGIIEHIESVTGRQQSKLDQLISSFKRGKRDKK